MSQKYPEGAVIVNVKMSPRRYEVLGCAGEVRFIQAAGAHCSGTINNVSAAALESEGWTVEEAPWKPEELGRFAYISSNGSVGEGTYAGVGSWCHALYAIGNCYEPGSQALKDAQARVLKAYKGV